MNNGKPVQSTAITVQSFRQLSAGAAQISAATDSLVVDLTLTPSHVDPVIVTTLSLRNFGRNPLFVRAVFPKFRGLIAAGDWSQNMGMIPQEMGVVAPLHIAPAQRAAGHVRGRQRRRVLDTVRVQMIVNSISCRLTLVASSGGWYSTLTRFQANF